MASSDYSRVDFAASMSPASPDTGAAATSSAMATIRVPVILLTVLLCVAQAFITITAIHIHRQTVTSTLISVVAFGTMVLLIALINPLVRWASLGRIRPLGRAEAMSMTASLMVTAGVSTFGLVDQLVPLIPAPWNADWASPQSGWNELVKPRLRPELYITDAKVITGFREGAGMSPAQDAPWSEWWSYYRHVWEVIPWIHWLGPLSLWLIFILGCYGIFFSLSFVVLDQWVNREKLIFPLVKLQEAILPEDERSWIPSLFRSPLFWAGFAVSAGVLGYNSAAVANWIPLMRLNLGLAGLGELPPESLFYGIRRTSFLIIFTAIGIAFLLPLEISFSIWFYFIAARLLALALHRSGNEVGPTEWIWQQNQITSQAAGGMLLFSGVCLYRCVREYVVLSRGRSFPRRMAVLSPVAALALCVAVVTCWIGWNGVPFHWALLFTLFMTLLTLGLMRIVAESGIYFFQAHASFFHAYKMLGLGRWMSPALIAPLLPIYSLFMLDVKTFIAPNILHAAKMRQDMGGSRVRFYGAVIASLAATVGFSIVYSIFLAYSRGANQMEQWFYSIGPRSLLETAAQATTRQPDFDMGTFAWFSGGAAWTAISLFARHTMFWFPHPVGYIMLINPLMNSLWFSFFVGWVFKKIVVKYGGKASFDRMRLAMLGLIVGELMIIFLAACYSMSHPGVSFPGVDLNRYGP